MAPLLETYLPIGRGRFAVFVTSENAVYEIVNYEVRCSGSKLFFFNFGNGTFNTGLRCPGSRFYICPNPFSVATNAGQTLQQIRFVVEPPQIIQLPGPIATSTYDSSRGSYGGYGATEAKAAIAATVATTEAINSLCTATAATEQHRTI